MKTRLATLAAILMVMPLSIVAALNDELISPWVTSQMNAAIQDCFGPNLEESVQIKYLTGGYSATSVRLDIAGKSYVLRVISESEPSIRVNTELDAMKKAAAVGVAPRIHWISPSGYAILMDYIVGETLTIERSKEPEVIDKIADLLRKVHALPKNPFSAPSFEEHMENFYRKYSQEDNSLSTWTAAISLIRKGASELENYGSLSLNTHGDLSPRNILISNQVLYFIDWSEGMYTEPFHDLGYFSTLMDYSPSEDAHLLKSYLCRNPTALEKKRFLLAKKMNFGRLALGGQYIGNKLSSEKTDASDTPQPLQEWSYYAKTFANTSDSLSSQFFWNLAQAALKSAHAIDIDSVD